MTSLGCTLPLTQNQLKKVLQKGVYEMNEEIILTTLVNSSRAQNPPFHTTLLGGFPEPTPMTLLPPQAQNKR